MHQEIRACPWSWHHGRFDASSASDATHPRVVPFDSTKHLLFSQGQAQYVVLKFIDRRLMLFLSAFFFEQVIDAAGITSSSGFPANAKARWMYLSSPHFLGDDFRVP